MVKAPPDLLRYATEEEMRACKFIAQELALRGKQLKQDAGSVPYLDLTKPGVAGKANETEEPGEEREENRMEEQIEMKMEREGALVMGDGEEGEEGVPKTEEEFMA